MQVQVLSRPPKNMIKLCKYISPFLIFVSILLFPRTFCSAEFAEYDKSFETSIVVNSNGTIDVSEWMAHDFGTNQKHGIFRNINTVKVNEEGKSYLMSISLKGVVNETGLPYTQTSSVNRSSYDIKIGDANKFVTGLQTYVINYSVSGAITYYTDHDELYWNMTGNDCAYPIKTFTGKVTLPPGISANQIKAECFDGPDGSTTKNCTTKIVGNTVLISESKEVAPYEGVTVVVSFPKGFVAILEPTPVVAGPVPTGLAGGFLSIVTLVFFLWAVVLPIIIFINAAKERAELKRKSRIVAAWFEAPSFENGTKFTPAQTGFIYSKAVTDKELTATIIDLAMRGYLKIKNDGKNKYSFEKLKEFSTDASLKDFEKTILAAIFSPNYPEKKEVSVSELGLNASFTNAVAKFKKEVEKTLMDEGLFRNSPSSALSRYGIIGFFAVITVNIPLIVASFLFGIKSARRTDKGIEKYSEAASLRNFLVSQDEQIDFQAKNQLFFEKLLPYATAFGVEDIWSKRFEGMQFSKSGWYDGDVSNAMALSAFSHTFRSSVKASSRYSTTTSSSGFHSGFSGGHSGGGGGGGSRGSW
jgi:hypothetical protein